MLEQRVKCALVRARISSIEEMMFQLLILLELNGRKDKRKMCHRRNLEQLLQVQQKSERWVLHFTKNCLIIWTVMLDVWTCS